MIEYSGSKSREGKAQQATQALVHMGYEHPHA